MSYSIAIGPLQLISESTQSETGCTCSEANKACIPSFVFSISGQVKFRAALDHLSECNSRRCISLRKKVKDAMKTKLSWLFEEEAILGCIQIQPFIYREKRIVDITRDRHFITVASHLSQCPSESCSKLRRSLLLSVRDNVSPNARALVPAVVEDSED